MIGSSWYTTYVDNLDYNTYNNDPKLAFSGFSHDRYVIGDTIYDEMGMGIIGLLSGKNMNVKWLVSTSPSLWYKCMSFSNDGLIIGSLLQYFDANLALND